MDWLKSMVNVSFKYTSGGEWVYYPSGIFGKGYIVPEEVKDDIAKTLTKIYLIQFLLVIPTILVLGRLGSSFSNYFLSLLGIIVVGVVGFWLLQKTLLSSRLEGRQVSDVRLGILDGYRTMARSFSKWSLWFAVGFSLFMDLMGIGILIEGLRSGKVSVAIVFGVGILLFGVVVGLLYGYMLSLKYQSE